MSDDWRWDDERIPSDQMLYRHAPKEPHPQNPKSRLDPSSRKWVLTAAAFTKNEMREDGWSIYREQLMLDNGLTVHDIEISDPALRSVWEFSVGNARGEGGAGVVDEEDDQDQVLGKAHGLVRCREARPSDQQIVELRALLISRARLV